MSKIANILKENSLRREFRLENPSDEDRTVELAFSSEAQVERWGLVEVLDHARQAVNLERLNDGAPLLFNHNRDDYIGVLESAQIDGDRKGRAKVRFSKSDRAEKIWQDVKDGILTKISIGYTIDDWKEEKRDNKEYLIATKWTPYEVSIVTVPADNSVGIGRGHSNNEKNLNSKTKIIMNTEQMINFLIARGINPAEDASDEQLRSLMESVSLPKKEDTAPKIDVIAERGKAVSDEQARVRSILEMGKQYKLNDLARDFVAEGKSSEDFKAEALKQLDQRAGEFKSAAEPVGLSQKEINKFSILRALRAMAADPTDRKVRDAAGFEFEVSEAAASKMKHRQHKGGLVVPVEVLRQPLEQRDIVAITNAGGYTGTGGNVVDTTLLTSSFVELLRNNTIAMRLGRAIGGLVGNIDIPKQVSGSVGYWIGEDEEATQEDINFAQVSMTPHTVANYGEVTRRLLMQDSIDVEALFRADLANGLAQTIDLACFYGDGTGNQPIGVLNTTGINGVTFVAADPTFAELVQMETVCALDNAPIDSAVYVADPSFRGYAKTNLKFTGVAGTIWEPGNSVNGYNAEITTQIAAGDVFFGNFNELLIGMWGGLEITLDPYTHSTRGRLRILAMQDVDTLVRRPVSFCYGTKP